MKTAPTQSRAFRLPRLVDTSTREAAKTAGVSQTAIVVRILTDAMRRGDLPAPKTERDRRQLEFI